MSPANLSAFPEVKRRAAELFADQSTRTHGETDRAFAALLLAQWIAGIVIALWISPRTWIGSTSQVHLHVWAAVLLGGGITVPAAVLGLVRPGRTSTRHVIAVAQMLDSALLIHLTGGRIETHFHVFGSLAFLAFYRDWKVLLSATVVVAIDHFWRGVFWPQSVFGIVTSTNWRWLEHAWWVIFEDFFLLLGIRRAIAMFREIAQHRAELELSHHAAEEMVLERTSELANANCELQARIAEQCRTERELERARNLADAASKAKSQFLANMSHEVRTPINGIMGMNSLMLETELTPQQREYVTTIRDCSETLLGVVSEVLDFSRIEKGELSLQEQPIELPPWLDKIIERHRAVAAARGLRFDVALPPTLPTRIVADGARLADIIAHLVGNAVKFTKCGGVSMRIESIPIEAADNAASRERGIELRIAVSDTGPGIPADQIAGLFREFSQVDDSMSRRHGGVGLGLVITKRLAELMNGGIEVDSTPEVGSTFVVTVRVRELPPSTLVEVQANAGAPPVSTADPAGRGTADSSAEIADLNERPIRILLAEDNVVNQRVATRLLQRLGLSCDVVENGREALEALNRRTYDVVLMDVQMPEMDGLAATAEILRQFSPADRPQIIAVTAHASDHDRAQCLAAGMDDFLTKPVRMDALATKLREASARLSRRTAELGSSAR